ncbi:MULTISPECIES: hypothetical protein [Peribacillus]|uniref:hypothetical protein n=1 Tax=Peribacillus simplex TaxID=1478 RepID=UPI001F4EA070|nr:MULTISPECIES: hypothetical protein [unclassified Peribacillus]MCK1983729.1 hypothetical protein [Peribacillus sp. Aquil_B1]MCK2009851.1 hypothetical protein [Peribacillus sp. Aquil_B8]
MANLYGENIPIDKDVMKTVTRMMIKTEEDSYTLYGKQGRRQTLAGMLVLLK